MVGSQVLTYFGRVGGDTLGQFNNTWDRHDKAVARECYRWLGGKKSTGNFNLNYLLLRYKFNYAGVRFAPIADLSTR